MHLSEILNFKWRDRAREREIERERGREREIDILSAVFVTGFGYGVDGAGRQPGIVH